MRRLLFLALLFFCIKDIYSQNISGVVNIYRKVLWADSASGRLKLNDVSGFTAYTGYKAIIMQMKGASMDATSTSAFGNITAINNAGYYEVGSICGFLNDTVVMERKLNNLYDVSGLVQFVIIPKYTNATVVDTLKAMNWNDSTGGIVAIEVTGSLTLNKPIDASGAGFRGGAWNLFGSNCSAFSPPTNYYFAYVANSNNNGAKKGEGIASFVTNKEYGRGKQTNGGGGGNNHNCGGGGGSNYGDGGQGGAIIPEPTFGSCTGTSAGIGGTALNTYGYSLSPSTQNRVFFGGGGGAGHDNSGYGIPGGNGGGIVLIMANTIVGNSSTVSDNKISANGDRGIRYLPAPYNILSNDAASDGAGGAGAGGTVIIKANSFSGNLVILEANGADGSGTETGGQHQCKGPGGGGGGGVVWLSQSSTPSGVFPGISGGVNGTTSGTASCPNAANGATAGGNGMVLYNFAFAAPKDSSTICKQILPIRVIINLSGYKNNADNHLAFSITNFNSIYQILLQSSFDGVHFYDIKQWSSSFASTFNYIDVNASQKKYYRVKSLGANGIITYSAVLHLNVQHAAPLSINIIPNPVSDFVNIQVDAETTSAVTIYITDINGKKIQQENVMLYKGANAITLSSKLLPAGFYTLHLVTKNTAITNSFIKTTRL